MILNGRILTSAVMLTIFAGMSIMATGYPEKARFLPLLIGVPGTFMSLAQLLFDIRIALRGGTGEETVEAADERQREIKMFFWLAVFLVGILSFGFYIAAPILVCAFLRFASNEPWPIAILGGIGAWMILYLVFTRLLELFLFEGFVTRLLIG